MYSGYDLCSWSSSGIFLLLLSTYWFVIVSFLVLVSFWPSFLSSAESNQVSLLTCFLHLLTLSVCWFLGVLCILAGFVVVCVLQ